MPDISEKLDFSQAPVVTGQPVDSEPSKPVDDAPKGADAATDKGDKNQGDEAAPKTALEAAKAVMAKEGKDASEKPQEGEPDAKAKPEGEGKDDPDAKLPFANHQRWKETTSELRILRVAKEKNEEAIKALTPKAQTYDELSNWLQQSNLAKDDFANLLTIGAAVRNEPFKAYELLKPIMDQLEGIVGTKLPADIQAKVDQGLVDPETARDLARARGEAAVHKSARDTIEQRVAREREEAERSQHQDHAETIVQGIVSHVNSWASRDPDAARIRPFVEEAIELELRKRDAQGAQPRDVQEATAIVDAVVKATKDRMRSFIPPPQPRSGSILPVGGAYANAAAPVPQSSLDAANAALRAMG